MLLKTQGSGVRRLSQTGLGALALALLCGQQACSQDPKRLDQVNARVWPVSASTPGFPELDGDLAVPWLAERPSFGVWSPAIWMTRSFSWSSTRSA